MYINTLTREWPLSVSDIVARHPNTSFPAIFSPPDGYAVVFGTSEPPYDPLTHRVRQVTPVKIGEKWQQAWEVYELDAKTIAANQASDNQRILNECVSNTQKRLDDFAKTRNYDGILSLCTYATSLNPKFKAEGQYGVEARDATWAKLYDMLSEVEAGTRPKPAGYADIENELPLLDWPA